MTSLLLRLLLFMTVEISLRVGLSFSQFFKPSEISVFDLILCTTWKMFFNHFPVLTIVVEEINQQHVFFQCPIILPDLWPEIVHVMLLYLFVSALFVRKNLLSKWVLISLQFMPRSFTNLISFSSSVFFHWYLVWVYSRRYRL